MSANTQAQETENDWFFDMIINFLRSPRWKTPIMSFLDENCIIFDDEDENKLEYTKIHSDFKKMVEGLLDDLMAELEITQEQFMDACEKAERNPIHKKIVDQITAVDNFVAFKKLMVKRNTELNEQALKMLHKKESKAPIAQDSSKPEKTAEVATDKPMSKPVPPINQPNLEEMSEQERAAEEAMIKRAMEISLQIEQQKKLEQMEEEEMIRRVMEISEREERERLEKVKQEEEAAKRSQQPVPEPVKEEPVPQPTEKPVEQPIFEEQKIEATQSVKHVEDVRVKGAGRPKKPEPVQLEPVLEKISKEPKKLGGGFDLPPVNMKRGGGAFDPLDSEFIKEQQKSLAQKKALAEFDELEAQLSKKPEEDGRSLKDMLQAKRETTEKALEGKQLVETPEERQKRLKAQRDLLVKMKQEKREKELGDFNQKTSSNKEDLHKELLYLDRKAKVKQQMKSSVQPAYSVDDELEHMDDGSPEGLDKRLLFFKNLRNELLREESKTKEDNQKQKMDELNAKIEKMEALKKERERKKQEEEEKERAKQDQRKEGNKNFLGNIKSFAVDDI